MSATSHGSSTPCSTAANSSRDSTTAPFTLSVTAASESVTICSEKLSALRQYPYLSIRRLSSFALSHSTYAFASSLKPSVVTSAKCGAITSG